ncbi:N-acetyl-gamma-glutamyl-phosphate reductase [Pyrus ussuriensis x Pyrus communis]|uniref:N-acetyl-gamma-glutamyl-phosphate reductase n=1 Tax=Pyrus ussuriensis x Pyrus communis TaxID=2448454 RepID=A0A5N5G0G1_9ROSA|nr:N-acetyl-gamma-glutamyl-phosphate reductase [Pyrus ussuriensis x Pyrus communis]KAB2604004.1 N-acetyl-gamma-glutamyl-phosphate reductase [Pyrus ussuriensis x Pyrus communis]
MGFSLMKQKPEEEGFNLKTIHFCRPHPLHLQQVLQCASLISALTIIKDVVNNLKADTRDAGKIVRLLANHPHFVITLMTADRKAEQSLGSVFPLLVSQVN